MDNASFEDGTFLGGQYNVGRKTRSAKSTGICPGFILRVVQGGFPVPIIREYRTGLLQPICYLKKRKGIRLGKDDMFRDTHCDAR